MDRYVGGEEIAEDVLVADLERAVARATFFPVVPVCSATGVGCTELLDLAVRAFPSPAEHPHPRCSSLRRRGRRDRLRPRRAAGGGGRQDHQRPVRRPAQPRPGLPARSSPTRPCTCRVTSPRSSARPPATRTTTRTSGSARWPTPSGARRRPRLDSWPRPGSDRPAHPRGDRGHAVRRRRPPGAAAWSLPEPLLPVAIVAHSKADEDKLSSALSRLGAEDPSLHRQQPRDPPARALVHGRGPCGRGPRAPHRPLPVHVDQVLFTVSLRETFAGTAKGHGRHVKQSGGHGQYAVGDIEVEPLPEGVGLRVRRQGRGRRGPAAVRPSVEKGVRAQMERGVRYGYPVVDLCVTLIDGKSHSVDSSDMAFQTAALAPARRPHRPA